MSLQPPNTVVDDWVANSGTSHHTTPLAGKISTFRPLNSANHSLIVVGNGSTLQVTSVGDSVIPGPFYLSIMLVPNIVQTLLFVRRFTTDNLCFMEFDSFGLFVKDLSTRNMIVRSKSNSTGPLYTLRLPGSLTRCRPLPCAMSAVAALRVLAAVASSTWHFALAILALTQYLACLGHLLFPILAINMRFVMLASWANIPDYHFSLCQVVLFMPLTYCIRIFGPLRL